VFNPALRGKFFPLFSRIVQPEPAPELTPNAVVLRFTADKDEVHQQLESEAHLVNAIPRKGEIVSIEHQFHAVKEVVHNYDANGIEVHLGPSAESPKDAQEKAG
jgi:hypothetical protein